MTAGIYLRVSTEEQRERHSIETQRDFAERWLAQHDIAPVVWYVDDGVSGTIPLASRPGGCRLLADAKAGQISRLYVYKVDRLGRDPLVTMQAADDLHQAGVHLESMTESIDSMSPHGRLSLVMLCGIAGYERDSIVARSIAGTDRLARQGTWLGGIVPFGYMVFGKGRDARLGVADDLIPGVGLSEADVVRLIFRHSAEDRWSCPRIADELNSLGIPPSYTRAGRSVTRGKRTAQTAGIWRAGRIRNLLVNPTYRGLHTYGKRSNRDRELIERLVPAIVTEETWEEAQRSLRRNAWASKRNSKRDYLLRGLIRCGTCGLTYSGSSWTTKAGEVRTYYSCNGRSQHRGIFGARGEKCPAKAVSRRLEDLVWEDIVSFAIESEDIIAELRQKGASEGERAEALRHEAEELRRQLAGFVAQRDRVLTLYRRGGIDDTTVDRQLATIEMEREDVARSQEQILARLESNEAREAHLDRAGFVLYWLVRRLDGKYMPLNFATKRELVEALVDRIVIETVKQDGNHEQVARVTYVFTPIEDRTGRDSSPR